MASKANNFSLFAGSSHPKLAKTIAEKLGVSLGKVEINRFPDHEISLQIQEEVGDKDVYVIQSLALEPNDYLVELLIMVDALKRAGARRITAVIPYFGYCRQDRQDKLHVPITAKLVADLLQTAGIHRVVTADLHAGQLQGFFDVPVVHLHCMPLLVGALRKFKTRDLIIVTPDVGSIKLGRDYADQLNVGLAVVNKQRLKTHKVDVVEIMGNVKGKDVLLADDICSTGATLTSAAKACREKGAKRILGCVTHGLFVGDSLKQFNQSDIEALITTDTVPFKRPEGVTTKDIHVVSSAPLFSQAIKKLAV